MSKHTQSASKRFRGAQLAEFSVVPFILLLLSIPIIDLTGMAASFAYLSFAAFACANKAAISADYGKALSGMSQQAQIMFGSPFATFLRISPIGGYEATGCDLYIVNTDNVDHSVVKIGPNAQMSSPPDENKTVSEYQVLATSDVSPLIPLELAFLKDVPMIGRSTTLRATWSRAVENQVGLAKSEDVGATDGGIPSLSLRVAGIQDIDSLSDFSSSSWRDPHIYDYLEESGHDIGDEDVLIVRANNSKWTDSNIFVYPVNKVWIDYSALGVWKYGTGLPLVDADGVPVQKVGGIFEQISGAVPGDTGFMLVQFGNAAPMRVSNNKMIRPNGTGNLKLLGYDKDGGVDKDITGDVTNPAAYDDNAGRMRVRIVVTK